METKPDFSGYATKAGLKCSDGRTIMPNAFEQQDQVTVPLVWQHGHDSPSNVLGKAVLENRPDGVYCHAYFNNTESAQDAKLLVQHGDVNSLSIYANSLVERTKQVIHGVIREVSLVLSGANPGALIDHVNLEHGDGSVSTIEDEAVIYTGLGLSVSMAHAEGDDDEDDDEDDDDNDSDEKTVEEVYNSLSKEQKDVVHFMIGVALEGADKTGDSKAEHSGSNEDTLIHQEGTDMSRNVFDQNATSTANENMLTHSQLVDIVKVAEKGGSFKEAVLAHAQEYGIENIDYLFPDAKLTSSSPEFISRRMEWVSAVLNGTKHSPFAKVKSVVADITADEARAKGYVKGNRKVEEVIKLLRRSTGPATVYKKQKLDRDDMLDITDIDVVAWLKAEIRLMLEEEIARAILVGDGRSSLSEDKIKDPEGAIDGTGIRSILLDDDLYSIKHELAANVAPKDAVKGLVRARAKYRGTGKPTLFISDNYLTDIMLEEDKFGRALYETEQALSDKLRVSQIITVDLFDDHDDLFAIMVNLADYTIGSNKGGELTSFEDFDIDFNQHKYLQETRISGGLTKPFSAVVVTRGQGTAATAAAPSFDGDTNTITIPESTGVIYTIDDEVVTGDVEIVETTEVEAKADEGYYLAPNTTRSWTFSV